MNGCDPRNVRFRFRLFPIAAHLLKPHASRCARHGDHVLEKLCHTILAIRFQWLPPLRAERSGLIGKKRIQKTKQRGRKLFHLLLENSPFMLLPQGRNVGKWKTKVISHKMLLSFVFYCPHCCWFIYATESRCSPWMKKINKWIKRKRKKGTKETSRR